MTVSRQIPHTRNLTPASQTNIDFEGLKKLLDSPVAQNLPRSSRQMLNVIQQLYPDQFAPPQPVQPPPLEDWEQAFGGAKTKAAQLEALGIAQPGTLGTLADQGWLPEYQDKNIWGRLKETGKFPLQKVMSGLLAFPRAQATAATAGTKDVLQQLNQLYGTDYRNVTDVIRSGNLVPSSMDEALERIKATYRAAPKMAGEGIKAFFNLPGEYEGYEWTRAIKDLYPDTKLTEPFGFTEGWEEGNWLQRLGSGFVGSPADITGLGLNIATNPLTYLTGGLAKGSKMIGKATKAITAKDGTTIIPKGLNWALKGDAMKKWMPQAEKYADTIMKKIAQGTMKKPFAQTDDIIRQHFVEKSLRAVAENKIKNMSYGEALKHIDLGGLKFKPTGTSIVPGTKLQQTVLPAARKVGELPGIRNLQQMLRPGYKQPDYARPQIGAAQHAARASQTNAAEKYAQVTKGLNTGQVKTVDRYMNLMSGQEMVNTKLVDVQKKIANAMAKAAEAGKPARIKTLLTREKELKARLTEYADELSRVKLDPASSKAAKELGSMFKHWAAEAKSKGRLEHQMQRYFPTRYTQKSQEALANRLGQQQAWGVKKTPFEYGKRYDYLKGLKEGLEPVKLKEAIKIRAAEQAKMISRADAFGRLKTFAEKAPKFTGKGAREAKKAFNAKMKQQGFSKAKNIPELEGWYVPDEFQPMLGRMESLFFGESALANSLKLYDGALNIWKRLALATPGYHFRNLWTDFQLGFMEYGLPYAKIKYWRMANDIAKYGKHAQVPAAKMTPAAKALANKTFTLGGQKYTVQRLYHEALNKGVNKTGFFKTEAAHDPFARGASKFDPLRASARVGQAREDITRFAPFLRELDLGADPLTAAFNVRKIFFDYKDLTPTEQNLFKRVIPFYSWVRKNIARQPEMLVTQPGRYAAIPAATTFIENISEIPEGYEAYQSDFIKEMGGIITPFRDPRTLEPLILNPNFAWQEWRNMSPSTIFSSLSPAIKIPFELIQNKEIFSKREITTGNPVPAPKTLSWAKALPESVLAQFGMKKSTDGKKLYMSPLAQYLHNQVPTLFNIARVLPGEPDENRAYNTLSISLGLKFWLYDEDKQKESYFKNYRAEADRLLAQHKTLGLNLPQVNDIVKAYKFAYDQHLRQTYRIDELDQWNETIEFMHSLGAGLPYPIYKSITDMQQREHYQPYREAYSEAVNVPLGELYPLMAEKGIDLKPEDIQAILDLVSPDWRQSTMEPYGWE